MIRVLHVVGNMDYGGVETFLMNLYRATDRERLQFDFVCHNDIPGKFDEEIRSFGGRIYRIPGIGATSVLQYRKALRGLFQELTGYNIVHSHQSRMNGIVLQQARKAGVPIRLSHAHASEVKYDAVRTALRLYSYNLIPANATHGIACSQSAAEFVHRGKLLRETELVHNAIDTLHFRSSRERRERVRAKLGLSSEFLVGHVGRFESDKNHRFLIEVFAGLLEQQPMARLVLVGVGSLENEIRSEVAERGIAKAVKFLGARADVRDLMDAMDVFVFPSLREGLGVVAVEAQSMGLPTLASSVVPRETELTDRITYLPLGGPGLWVDKLKAVAREPSQPREGYADDVASRGYDVMRVASELQRYYLDLINGSDKGGGRDGH